MSLLETRPARPPTAPLAGAPPRRLSARAWLALAVAAAVVWAGLYALSGGRALVNPGGWVQAWRFARAAAQPALTPDFLALTVRAALTTLAYGVCGTALSLLIGLPGGVLASERWWGALAPRRWARAPWLAVRAGLAVPRGLHEVIWGLFFVNVLGLDPMAAILAIAIPFGAITAKVYSEILDEVPPGPFEALLAAGTPPATAFGYALLPQALPNLLAYAFYRLECSLRSAAVLGVIGAGGLGYEMLLSFQSLKYGEMWTLTYALIALSGAVDVWSGLVRARLGSAPRLALNTQRAARRRAAPDGPGVPPQSSRLLRASLLLTALAIPASFWYVGANFATLTAPRAARLLADVAGRAWPPNLDPALLAGLLDPTLQTLAIAILAMALAASGGVALSFLAARSFMLPEAGRRGPGWAWGLAGLVLARGLLLVCRAIPASVWALLLLFVLFPGVVPGAAALGVYTLGVLGRLMAEVVEDLDERPLRALRALGATGPQVFAYGVLPRTWPAFASYILYRWEVCSRETVMVGVVGAAGLGRALSEQLTRFDYDSVLTTVLVYIALTFLVDLAGSAARRALR